MRRGQGEWEKYEDEESRTMMRRGGDRYCNDGNELRSIERRREGKRGG